MPSMKWYRNGIWSDICLGKRALSTHHSSCGNQVLQTDMKGVTLVVMAIVECEWLQYILYYDNHQTYSVDLPNQKDWLKFHKWLDGKFKAAGVKQKCAKGFLDHYWG